MIEFSASANFLEQSMVEPVTIGALSASVLALAAEAALKGAVGEAAKGAYNALKETIARWAASDVEALEKAPSSAARQAVVAEEIDRRPIEDKAGIRILVEELILTLEKTERDGPIGLDIGRLQAARVELGAIVVYEGTGVRAQEIETLENFTAGPIKVGQRPGKKQR
jgi:hypothetical protein